MIHHFFGLITRHKTHHSLWYLQIIQTTLKCCRGSLFQSRNMWLLVSPSHLNQTALLAYLADVHACIAAQRLRRHQSVWANHSGEQTSLINLLNGGAINEVDNTSFIHCDTWAGEREREKRQNELFGDDREGASEVEENKKKRRKREREKKKKERGVSKGEK